MQILLNTDNRLLGTQELTARTEEQVRRAVDRFAPRLTRIEVHLQDVNADKGGVDDITCTMEARPRGLAPLAVTRHAGSIDEALAAAAEALAAALTRTFGKLDQRR